LNIKNLTNRPGKCTKFEYQFKTEGSTPSNSNCRPNLFDLIKYQQHLTKRPVNCTKFEYQFKTEGSTPSSANSRPIPFGLIDPVSDQIQVMLKDDILEESFSSRFNPLKLAVRERKQLRICVDVRRNNCQTTADRANCFRNLMLQVLLPVWTKGAHFLKLY
jgi:hypothetical protein